MSNLNFGKLGTVSQMIGKRLGEARGKRGHEVFFELSTSDESVLKEVKLVDDKVFEGEQEISIDELRKIVAFGSLILMRVKASSELIGHSQILFHHIDEMSFHFSYPAGYCYSTGLLPEYTGEGFGRHIAYHQENLARAEGVTELFMAIRVSNGASLGLRLGMGYEIYECMPNFYGSDINKDLGLRLRKKLAGNLVFPPKNPLPPNCVFVPVGFDKPDEPQPVCLETHSQISGLLEQGYLGVGINNEGLFFCRHQK